MQETEANIFAATLASERAMDDLRRQLGVFIAQENRLTAALPLEFADDAAIAEFARLTAPSLVIAPSRAAQLGLARTEKPLRIDASGLNLHQIRHIADPLAAPVPLPTLDTSPAEEPAILALILAKHAALLPAVLVAGCEEIPAAFSHWQAITLDALKLSIRRPIVEMLPVADAKLPIEGAENAQLKSFRSRFGTSVHLALIIGEPEKQEAPLVRVHSSCVTGDILGSLRCDCGDQLHLALDIIRENGNGVLLYLHQEGRGIGIANKLRAYRLQEGGMDTYDANLALGFEEDERDFSIAAAILKQLGIARIKLLTNNPSKITALKGSGIVVAERVAVAAAAGKHNHNYLKAKAEKTGHLF